MRTIVPVLAEEREELMGGAVLLAIENLFEDNDAALCWSR
jgi:hypothetical protein